MPELKLRRTGNSLSTSWPKEALARMNAKEGDTLYAIETASRVPGDAFRSEI
jgi:putative addiction module antidote